MGSKKYLSERDICTQFITPAIKKAGWNIGTQLREEVSFTDGRIYVRGSVSTRGKRKRADYILYYKPNIPIAVVEAKDNKHTVGAGIQQAIGYADILDIPFVFSSNGDGFIFNDKTTIDNVEKEISLDKFPSPEELWQKYRIFKGLEEPRINEIVTEDYYIDGSSKKPRYYQQIAINRTIEAVAKEQKRILLVMATGTGKTYTAFQIIYRLWKSKEKKRILFLADRTALIDQTKRGDFKHFKDKMTIVKNKQINKAYEIYLALYQGLTSYDEDKDAYRQFSPDFFDLIVIDECHRGSAAEDSAWREILSYFSSATHIGLTATPKETKEISNITYFGDPVYTYSLKQGIDDGFLAPYKVIRVGLDRDLEGWRPEKGQTDLKGEEIEDRIYNKKDFDKNIVLHDRTEKVAERVTEFLKATNRFDKTIIFSVDIDHAERMRSELINLNGDLYAQDSRYVMQITGDNIEGKNELDNFINPEEKYPVIATTSKLMTTGVDAQTCKLIVLDSNINSMTEFKQIIGRGTRVNEDYGKTFFTIMDFRNVTDLFADPDFDGDPVVIIDVKPGEEIPNYEDSSINEPIIDIEDGEEVVFPTIIKKPDIRGGGDISTESRKKVYVRGVEVNVVNERVHYLDGDGKLITENIKDYTRTTIKEKYHSLNDFLITWNKAAKKEVIIRELEEAGVFFEELNKIVGKDFEPFDLISHIVYNMPALTRKERADNVKKKNYFTKYGEQAQKVLGSLLDKYADEGIVNIESMEVLKINPINQYGSLKELVNSFGGIDKYKAAVKELEDELYISIA